MSQPANFISLSFSFWLKASPSRFLASIKSHAEGKGRGTAGDRQGALRPWRLPGLCRSDYARMLLMSTMI